MICESIIFDRSKKLGKITDFTTKLWKKSPGDFTSACQAAAFYAKRDGEDMLIIPGNSYGSKIFHIVRKTDNLSKYAAGIANKSISCALVTSNGDVFQGIASQGQ